MTHFVKWRNCSLATYIQQIYLLVILEAANQEPVEGIGSTVAPQHYAIEARAAFAFNYSELERLAFVKLVLR